MSFTVPAISQSGTSDDIEQQLLRAHQLEDKGKASEARKLYEGLLPQLQEAHSTPQLADALSALSHLADNDGDYDAAVRYGQQSADAYRQAGDRAGEGRALMHQGVAEMDLGLYKAAYQTFRTALSLSNAVNDLENQVQILNNQGNTHYFEGSYFDALQNYAQASKIVDSASKTERWVSYWRLVTDFNQATLYQRLGRYQKALAIYKGVQESASSLTASNQAHLFGNLGALYRRLGDPYKALDSYQLAQKFYRQEHDADGEIGVLKNIGIVYAMDLVQLRRAQAIFSHALQLAKESNNRRELMQGHLYLGEVFIREKNTPSATQEFEQARDLASALGTTEEQWKAVYGLGRVMEIEGDLNAAEKDYREAILTIEKSRTGLRLSTLQAEFLADKRDVYDALLSILFKRQDVAEAFLFLERSRARRFQDRLEKSGLGSWSYITLNEARSHLDSDTMLLEFWVAGSRLGLIWCTRSAEGIVLKDIDSSVLAGIRGFLQKVPGPSPAWRRESDNFGTVLAEYLPAFPAQLKHVVIVPDEWVSFVPFDLVADRATHRQLIEEFDITYLPSAALWRRSKIAAPAFRFPWAQQLIAFGDPRLESGQNATDVEMQPQSLPHSAEEIRDIAALAHGKSEIFVGADDSKSAFLARANSAPLLHVSTHAFANADNPEDSRIAFTPRSDRALADYVFLRELYDLNLEGVEMATLSACDTERGAIVRGEGAQAFSRALLASGARSSVTTLWRVDDAATAQFMKLFYFYALQGGRGKAEALRLTKLKFAHSGSYLAHPSYWAAFVLNGDGIEPVRYVVSWSQLVAGAIICVGALAVLVWLLRRRHNRKQFA